MSQEEFTFAFLMDASEAEASAVEALLAAHEIPVERRYSGLGAISFTYCGGSMFGLNLYVPEESLEQAQTLMMEFHQGVSPEELEAQALAAAPPEDADFDEDDEDNENDEAFEDSEDHR